tara:strand:- start:5296 stop:5610 length:315 start_codon:yes stop_codon:yes gene_type:complete
MRHMTSVLLDSGKKLHFVQRQHESQPEFDGRVLCEIEEAITGERKNAPEGTRWAEWHHHGHALRRFLSNGLGVVYESTGEQYQNRKRRVPGLYNEAEAAAALRG